MYFFFYDSFPIYGLRTWVCVFPGVFFWFWFACKFSLSLRAFWGGGGFEFYLTCLVISTESEGTIIFRGLFKPLFPCAFVLSLRYLLVEVSFGLSLACP